MHTEVRNSFRAKLFVFDNGIIVATVLAKQTLQFKYYFAIHNMSIQIVSENRLDLIDLKQPSHVLSVTLESMKITELKKEFNGFRIESQCTAQIHRSPNTSSLNRKCKKNSRPQGKIYII